MAILKHIKRLKYIDYMIKRKATGNLESFAFKNNLSKRGLVEVIREMKELGFPIKYDRSKHTYYYDECGEMVKSLFIRKEEILSREIEENYANNINICFSEITVFELCKKK
jgi:sulfur transfer complex TusBCD TusB component (DsrH family)